MPQKDRLAGAEIPANLDKVFRRGIFTPDVLSRHIMDFDEDNSPRPVEAELDVEITKG
jgi:hypothetical protein